MNQPGRLVYSSIRICTPCIMRGLPYGAISSDRVRSCVVRLCVGQRRGGRKYGSRGTLTITHGSVVPPSTLTRSLCLFTVMNSREGKNVDSAIQAVASEWFEGLLHLWVNIESLVDLIHAWLLFDCVTVFKRLREAKDAAMGGIPTPSEHPHVVSPGSIQPIESSLHAAHTVERRSSH